MVCECGKSQEENKDREHSSDVIKYLASPAHKCPQDPQLDTKAGHRNENDDDGGPSHLTPKGCWEQSGQEGGIHFERGYPEKALLQSIQRNKWDNLQTI